MISVQFTAILDYIGTALKEVLGKADAEYIGNVYQSRDKTQESAVISKMLNGWEYTIKIERKKIK